MNVFVSGRKLLTNKIPSMEKLEFSRNDNCKLFLEYFSCIRMHDAGLYKIGNTLEIILRGESLGQAEVVAVRTFKFAHLSDVVSYLDNGKPFQFMAAAIKKNHPETNPDTELDHIVLHYTARNLDNQGNLLMAWWSDIYALHSHLEPNKPAMHG